MPQRTSRLLVWVEMTENLPFLCCLDFRTQAEALFGRVDQLRAEAIQAKEEAEAQLSEIQESTQGLVTNATEAKLASEAELAEVGCEYTHTRTSTDHLLEL